MYNLTNLSCSAEWAALPMPGMGSARAGVRGRIGLRIGRKTGLSVAQSQASRLRRLDALWEVCKRVAGCNGEARVGRAAAHPSVPDRIRH